MLEGASDIYKFGKMSKSMQVGIITLLYLLYKKGDPKLFNKYRPLTMLCVEYKILSKAITNHLAMALSHIVDIDQKSGVKGLNISWNFQLHRDVIAYVEDRHLSAICISLEQQKAFDRINHHLLIRILNHFDFGQNFLQWINILYSDIYFRVNMNRNLSKQIKQEDYGRDALYLPCSTFYAQNPWHVQLGRLQKSEVYNCQVGKASKSHSMQTTPYCM